jgi:formylglycine-generating enzyme
MTHPSYSHPEPSPAHHALVPVRRSGGFGIAARVSIALVALAALVLAREAPSGSRRSGRQTDSVTEAHPATPVAARVTELAAPPAGREAPAAETSATSCPEGMVLVEGEYCPAVAHQCTKYLSEERDRCAEFAETNRCFGKVEKRRFCIDRYEYPNQIGVKPVVAVTWEEAKASCEASGKRLCDAREWTLACEGPDRTPYPTGYRRDPAACNYDKPYIIPNDDAFLNPATRDREVERLSQSDPSGTRPQCVSAYGVYDMTGNVDEWVVNEDGTTQEAPYQSGLKGGYWGPVRNRCRPMTTDHNQWHSGYQIGFRCCADSPESAPPAAEDATRTAAGSS